MPFKKTILFLVFLTVHSFVVSMSPFDVYGHGGFGLLDVFRITFLRPPKRLRLTTQDRSEMRPEPESAASTTTSTTSEPSRSERRIITLNPLDITEAALRKLQEEYTRPDSRPLDEVILTDTISLDQLRLLQNHFPQVSLYTLINGRKAYLSLMLKPSEITNLILKELQERYSGRIDEVILADTIFLEEYQLLQNYLPTTSFYTLRNGRKIPLFQNI